MIARLEGIIIHKSDKSLIIDVSGVGYKLFVTNDSLECAILGEHTSFWVYTAVRENSIDLYGFKNTNEMSFFELLLDVSGIGPKSALSILGIASIDTLKRAIATGDMSYLNKVSGIGKKTAEKIIVELRDKLSEYKTEGENGNNLKEESDILEALKSLGYSHSEARDVLKEIPSDIAGANARIKEALRILGNK